MNVRRGLFRLWLVLSVLFALSIASLSYTEVRNEFFWRDADELGAITLLPAECAKSLGTVGVDYSVSEGLCWYELPKFRKLYPEYVDLNDAELTKRLYAKVGRSVREMRPWTLIARRAGARGGRAACDAGNRMGIPVGAVRVSGGAAALELKEDWMEVERCINEKCGRFYGISEMGGQMPGTREPERIECPYCGHVHKQSSNGFFRTHALTPE